MAAWRERERSPIKQAIKSLEKAYGQPVSQPCPICQNPNGMTDASLAVCQNGHQWEIKGGWQRGFTRYAVELYQILASRFENSILKNEPLF
jgi:hypothetical protein